MSNQIDELLADTAAFLHSRLREDRVLREHLRAEFEKGMTPYVMHVLGPEMPGDRCFIRLERPAPAQ